MEESVKKRRILLITILAIIPGGAIAADIGPEELASIVKGRKWQVAIGGDLGPATSGLLGFQF